MSDLGINGHNKISPSFGQTKKHDSYDHWNAQYKSFMQKFGDRADTDHDLWDTHMYILTNLKRVALAEGKKKEAAELEAKILAVSVGEPKRPAPPPQQVSAQQVLAMHQAPQHKGQTESTADAAKPDQAKPATVSEEPVPSGDEIGDADEWFDGWGDGTATDGIASPPGKKKPPVEEAPASAAEQKGNGQAQAPKEERQEDVSGARKRPEYPGQTRRKPEITGVDVIDIDAVQDRRPTKKPAAPPFRPKTPGRQNPQNGRPVYPQQPNPGQGGYPQYGYLQQPNPGQGGYPQYGYPQQAEPGRGGYPQYGYPQQANSGHGYPQQPVSGYPQQPNPGEGVYPRTVYPPQNGQGGYPQQPVSGYPQQPEPGSVRYPQQQPPAGASDSKKTAAPQQSVLPDPPPPVIPGRAEATEDKAPVETVTPKKPEATEDAAPVETATPKKPEASEDKAPVETAAPKKPEVQAPPIDDTDGYEVKLTDSEQIISVDTDDVPVIAETISDIPYEETVAGQSSKVLEESGGFKPAAAEQILSMLVSKADAAQAGKVPKTIVDISTLRAALTGKQGQRSHYTSVCTADLRSPLTRSKKSAEAIDRELVELLSGSPSEYQDREDIRRGLKTPEEIAERNLENRNNETEAIKSKIEQNEDEIIVKFVKKYKQPDGTINPAAYGVITALRTQGFVPDHSLLELTEACMKKNGQADVPKVNAIVQLKQAGALTDEVLSILEVIPRSDDGKFDKAALQDAADLTKAVIGMPELGDLLPQVKGRPEVKKSIAAVSPYYPHQKEMLQDLIPLMLDADGNEDRNAAIIVRDAAEYLYPPSQKLYADRHEDMDVQKTNIERVTIMTENILDAAKEDGSSTVCPIAVDILASVAESGKGYKEMVETLDICKDNEGKINENFAEIAKSLIEIGVEPDRIKAHLDRFTYRDGSVDDVKAKAEADSLKKETEELRSKTEQIKKLQAEAEQIRQRLNKRFG